MSSPAVVRLENVSRWYGNVLGLSGADLTLAPGVTALLGPNGAGKSTLIKLVTGLIRPSSGAITVFGEQPFANPRVNARLGVVPEEEELRPAAPVRARDFLTYLLRLHGFDLEEAERRADRSLAEVGLESAASTRVRAFSRGMRQRMRLAQAIAHDPDLLVLDEPLTGLDPVGRREFIDWIRGFGARGKTVLVSSHILHEVELMTREVVLMTAGRVLASGNIHEIRRLMDSHPHRIQLTTPTPKRLAARILEEPGLHSISFSEEDREVRLETREPERFFRLFQKLVLEEDRTIEEVTSPDDNLEAVFQYLVGT
ncbi:MAG: ABC transporter ATP-binding protein [Vicinamibacteria bacterium]